MSTGFNYGETHSGQARRLMGKEGGDSYVDAGAYRYGWDVQGNADADGLTFKGGGHAEYNTFEAQHKVGNERANATVTAKVAGGEAKAHGVAQITRDGVELGAEAELGVYLGKIAADGELNFTVGELWETSPVNQYAKLLGLDMQLPDWLAENQLQVKATVEGQAGAGVEGKASATAKDGKLKASARLGAAFGLGGALSLGLGLELSPGVKNFFSNLFTPTVSPGSGGRGRNRARSRGGS